MTEVTRGRPSPAAPLTPAAAFYHRPLLLSSNPKIQVLKQKKKKENVSGVYKHRKPQDFLAGFVLGGFATCGSSVPENWTRRGGGRVEENEKDKIWPQYVFCLGQWKHVCGLFFWGVNFLCLLWSLHCLPDFYGRSWIAPKHGQMTEACYWLTSGHLVADYLSGRVSCTLIGTVLLLLQTTHSPFYEMFSFNFLFQ